MASGKVRITLLLFCTFGVIAGAVLGGSAALYHDLPPLRQLESYTPSAITRIYSADDVLLGELYTEKREPVPLSAIPDNLKAAIIVVEDRQFYRHPGVNIRGILRALYTDLKTGSFAQGASTITQQLVRTLFLTADKNVLRKIREALLAFQVERRYTKDEILTLYLNQIYLGSGAYGVGAAARIFFGKPLDELTLAECALIAAMPRAPSRYSPLVNPQLARKRRNLVLKQMAANGIISQDQFQQATAEPLQLAAATPRRLTAPYFTAHIRKALEEQIGGDLLYQGGLTVTTTLDYRLQQAAEAALAQGLAALETRMQAAGLPTDDLQGALVALDSASGGIRAMLGGRDYGVSKFNRAVEARRQPGSAFKPIIYALAVTQGMAQSHLIRDTPVVYAGRDGDWRPANFSKTFQGEVTLRLALAKSLNIPAIRLVEQLGLPQLHDFSARMGLDLPSPGDLSLALGTAGVSLLGLTAAYAVWPNHGILVRPQGILNVRDAQGRTIWQPTPAQTVVMPPAEAAVITDMLRAVVLEGTGRRARNLPQPVAGKTGTTDQCHDALFLGFSPALTAGVWVGRDGFESLGARETGSRAALPIWLGFMEAALGESSSAVFDQPADTLRVSMDPLSGTGLAADSAGGVSALFIEGTEPRTP